MLCPGHVVAPHRDTVSPAAVQRACADREQDGEAWCDVLGWDGKAQENNGAGRCPIAHVVWSMLRFLDKAPTHGLNRASRTSDGTKATSTPRCYRHPGATRRPSLRTAPRTAATWPQHDARAAAGQAVHDNVQSREPSKPQPRIHGLRPSQQHPARGDHEHQADSQLRAVHAL